MNGILDIIVGIIFVIIFIFIVPKIWNSNENFVGNLINAGIATMFIIGGAILILKFLVGSWFIDDDNSNTSAVIQQKRNIEKEWEKRIARERIEELVLELLADLRRLDEIKQKYENKNAADFDPADLQEIEAIKKRLDKMLELRNQDLEEYFKTHGGLEEQLRRKEEWDRRHGEYPPIKPQTQAQTQLQNNHTSTVQKPLEKNWIRDNANDIYMQNPAPEEGESISWSGSYVLDGGYKFAEGCGTTVWRNKHGEIVQVDEGTFKRGKRQGKMKHQFFPSGDIVYSNWKNGKEIK